jgi:hypothetical protein
MKIPLPYIIIAAIIIIIAAAAIVYTGSGDEKDTTPPEITFITGDTYVNASETVTIEVNFSDNVEVTQANLYYKKIKSDEWNSMSILNKTASIDIPDGSSDQWCYYIIVNDAAGNGPIGDPSINGSIYYIITVLYTPPNDSSDENYTKYAFLLEGTYRDCKNCPYVAEILYDLYNSGEYPFYYVSLVEDRSTGKDHLENDYNADAYPIVYVDSGYDVIIGRKEKYVYIDAIQEALSRDAPKISANITADKKENSTDINLNIRIKNHESSQYKGTLKVYLTEIESATLQDNIGKPYHFAFIDFALNEEITISADGNYTTQETLDADLYDYENLMIFAVVFNNNPVEKFSGYEANTYPFDAYFADAVDGVKVVEGGNLPPSVGITYPKSGKLHIFGEDRFNTLFQNTIIIGKTIVTAQASDDEGLDKVEFFLDNESVAVFTDDGPYEWEYTDSTLLRFRHTIKIVATDNEGKQTILEIPVFAFV